MTDEIIGQRFFEAKLPDGRYVRANAKLWLLDGNAAPYFSLTGEVWRSKTDYDRNQTSGSERGFEESGALGGKLVEWFPDLAEFEPLHLSNADGAPIYAVENGWYWYSDYYGRGGTAPYESHSYYHLTPHERAADYLRIEPGELPEGMDKEEFAAFVDTLRDRWMVEADKARKVLGLDPVVKAA